MKKCFIFLLAMILVISVSPALAEQITVGTSAEYRPFVYYDSSNELTGFDIELIREIGKREGFTVRFFDMAFDGLIDSVRVGQIDLIGGAFSVTPSRQKEVLFSDTYYTNQAIIIALKTGDVPDTLKVDDITNHLIGVQRGSSFDQWLKTNLVADGLLSTQKIFAFSTVNSAIKALQSGTIDLLMFDEDLYKQVYEKSGNFKIVNNIIGDEEYAFAAAPDSKDLIARINHGLAQMTADGSLEQLIKKYTNDTEEEAEITISRPSQIERTPVMLPTPTPIPPFGQPANCKNVMVYMADVTYPDGSKVNPGTKFTKTWRIYNNGSCKWYEGYSINFVDGDYMSANTVLIPSLTIPGTTVDVGMEMTAPQAPGAYIGYYQLRAPDGTFFGPKLTAKIIVTEEQVSAPPAGAPPLITRFQPNYYKGGKKFCPTVYWTVSDATQIRISINNKPVYTTTQGSGSIELCPGGGRGDYIYGIVAEGSKRASYVFTYTNTGE